MSPAIRLAVLDRLGVPAPGCTVGGQPVAQRGARIVNSPSVHQSLGYAIIAGHSEQVIEAGRRPVYALSNPGCLLPAIGPVLPALYSIVRIHFAVSPDGLSQIQMETLATHLLLELAIQEVRQLLRAAAI